MPGRFEYIPKGDVTMRVEIRKVTARTCGGRRGAFSVTRTCSHGCSCTGEYITKIKTPGCDLVKNFATCGKPGLRIKGPGKDVALVEFQAGIPGDGSGDIWVFEMLGALVATQFVHDDRAEGGQ
jgi:hypothetical protein